MLNYYVYCTVALDRLENCCVITELNEKLLAKC
jgi:hypothetical protein